MSFFWPETNLANLANLAHLCSPQSRRFRTDPAYQGSIRARSHRGALTALGGPGRMGRRPRLGHQQVRSRPPTITPTTRSKTWVFTWIHLKSTFFLICRREKDNPNPPAFQHFRNECIGLGERTTLGLAACQDLQRSSSFLPPEVLVILCSTYSSDVPGSGYCILNFLFY